MYGALQDTYSASPLCLLMFQSWELCYCSPGFDFKICQRARKVTTALPWPQNAFHANGAGTNDLDRAVACMLRSCSSLIFPKTAISSAIPTTPLHPSKVWSRLVWKTSRATLRLKGMRLSLYILNVVRVIHSSRDHVSVSAFFLSYRKYFSIVQI